MGDLNRCFGDNVKEDMNGAFGKLQVKKMKTFCAVRWLGVGNTHFIQKKTKQSAEKLKTRFVSRFEDVWESKELK